LTVLCSRTFSPGAKKKKAFLKTTNSKRKNIAYRPGPVNRDIFDFLGLSIPPERFFMLPGINQIFVVL
jgi:hypothetical protein